MTHPPAASFDHHGDCRSPRARIRLQVDHLPVDCGPKAGMALFSRTGATVNDVDQLCQAFLKRFDLVSGSTHSRPSCPTWTHSSSSPTKGTWPTRGLRARSRKSSSPSPTGCCDESAGVERVPSWPEHPSAGKRCRSRHYRLSSSAHPT